MKKPVKVIFIPNNAGGTPRDNWFPYLEKTFTQMGIQVIAQDFPDNDIGRENCWLPFLKHELKADQNTILIGYSTGAIAAMRFAEKNKILGSILVATYYTDLGDEKEKEARYFDRPRNWKAIKKNQRWIVQFASTDDPYIPLEEAHLVHEKLEQNIMNMPTKAISDQIVGKRNSLKL